MADIPVASSNVVLKSEGATVTGYVPFGYAKNCIDGKEKSFASFGLQSPITFNLVQPYLLSSVRIKVKEYGCKYTIESSPDGVSWEPVGCETKEKSGKIWRTFEFSRRVVRHFRITVKKYGFGYLTLHHFESPASK